jgi:uncharacterized membrane protein YhfC
MICLPIGLAAYINSKYKTNWHLWWSGGAVFVLSQIGHIPFNFISGLILNRTNLIYLPQVHRTIFNALFLGLSAGLWEEIARYSAFRWWVGKKRSWKAGIQLGVGHGGIESIILGVLVLYTFIQMVAVRNIDISTLVPPDQLSQTIEAVASYWAAPWYSALLGGVERILTLPIQIALSVIVAQVFIRGKRRWIWFAILFHMVVDSIAVLFMSFSNVYITELAVALFSAISIWIIFVLRTPESVEEGIDENSSLLGSFQEDTVKFHGIHEIDDTLENLDATKYQ